MRLKQFIVFFISILVLLLSGAFFGSADVTFTDTPGNTVSIPAIAQRIVCLNSDAAEMMAVLGKGHIVVGLTDSIMTDTALMTHFPNAVSVGDWQTPSFEKVLQLKPDAVIAYSSSKPKNADQFASAGINLTYLECYKFTTIEHDVQSLGIMVGAQDKAEKYSSFVKKWKEQINSRVSRIPSEMIPSVYVEGYSDYSAQGKGSGVDILMGIAKGKNLAAKLEEQWPKVTPEWIISENPSIIIKTASLKPDKNLDKIRSDVLGRSGFETLSAIKNKQVYVLNGDLTYGPRSPAGLVYLAKAMHPEECKDISPGDVLNEYAEMFVSGMEAGDYYAPSL